MCKRCRYEWIVEYFTVFKLQSYCKRCCVGDEVLPAGTDILITSSAMNIDHPLILEARARGCNDNAQNGSDLPFI